jgi:hypothetical protein
MNIRELTQWQWDGYVKYHSSRINLLIHIVAVPLFILGAVLFLLTLVNFNLISVTISILLMVASMGVQGFGHGKEKVPAVPFSGSIDTISRIFIEQLFNFPKFVISGEWYKALRRSSQP